MTELQESIADYLANQQSVRPHVRAAQSLHGRLTPPPLPPAEELTAEFFDDAEFRALQLGTVLNTTEGQIIAEAVARVLPPGYQPAFDIVVEALQAAAAKQTGRSRLSAAGLAVVGFLVIFGLGGS